jgi:hypothetical protein
LEKSARVAERQFEREASGPVALKMRGNLRDVGPCRLIASYMTAAAVYLAVGNISGRNGGPRQAGDSVELLAWTTRLTTLVEADEDILTYTVSAWTIPAPPLPPRPS